MNTVTYRTNPEAVRQLISGTNGPIYGLVTQLAIRVRTVAADRTVPKKDGHLGQSLSWTVRNENGVPTGYVGSKLKYAIWVHEGTGRYGPLKRDIIIRPKSAVNGYRTKPKALAFVWNNQKFVRRKVAVKGMRPRPFLVEALKIVFGAANVRS